MRAKQIAIVCTVAVLGVLSVRSVFPAGESKSVKNLSVQVRAIIENKDRKRAEHFFTDNIDIETFASRCLIDNRRMFSDEDYLRYKGILKDLLRQKIKKSILRANGNSVFSFRVDGVKKWDGAFVRIDTTVATRKSPFRLSLIVSGSGAEILIADYELEGALLSRQYRAQFNKYLRNHSVYEFIAKLFKETDEAVLYGS